MTGRPGGLVATREYYERWSLSSIPTVVRFDFTCKNKWKKHKKGKLLRALSSVGRYNSTRVNKGRKWWIFFAIKKEGTYRSAEGGAIQYLHLRPDWHLSHTEKRISYNFALLFTGC